MDKSLLFILLFTWALVGAARMLGAKRPAWESGMRGGALFVVLLALGYSAFRLFQTSIPSEQNVVASEGSLFAADLVASANSPFTVSEGLAPREHSLPWQEPLAFRRAGQAGFTIVLPPAPFPRRVQLDFSVRPTDLKLATLQIRLNGQLVQDYPLADALGWTDCNFELTVPPGAPVLELTPTVRSTAPNWLGYLELYPDVRRAVIAQNEPLEEGSRRHYEIAGRIEGRTLPLIELPVDNSNPPFLIFRRLRLEGFPMP